MTVKLNVSVKPIVPVRLRALAILTAYVRAFSLVIVIPIAPATLNVTVNLFNNNKKEI